MRYGPTDPIQLYTESEANQALQYSGARKFPQTVLGQIWQNYNFLTDPIHFYTTSRPKQDQNLIFEYFRTGISNFIPSVEKSKC